MKKFLVAIMFGLMAIAAQAEATFDQVQTLIEQKNYQAAEQGLEVIIKNHPQSAKAFYAMAQAQAGLGNLDKAQKALNIATGLNPTLDFAPASSVASLKQAITPQVAKIESIEESHTVRNTILIIFVIGMGFVVYSVYRRNKEAEEAMLKKQQEHEEAMEQVRARMAADREKDRKAASEFASSYTPRPAYQGAQRTVNTTPPAQPAQPAPTTTVINNTTSNSSNDLLTGVLIGNMLSDHHSHDTTRVVERERVIEREVPSKSSTWDDTPSRSSSRSSSWDDDSSSSSSKSSSWDSGSSSSSSSSWDSGSSSSDSGSSSSWD